MNNYEMLFTDTELECYPSDIRGKFSINAFHKNQYKRSFECWKEEIGFPENDIWSLQMEPSLKADNDTDSSGSSDHTECKPLHLQDYIDQEQLCSYEDFDDFVNPSENEEAKDSDSKKAFNDDSSSSSSEAYEDFAWFRGQEIQAKREPDTFIAFYNDSRRTALPGEQLFYCYGKRSNHFLLLNYGFCIADNCFDAFEIWLNIDVQKVAVRLDAGPLDQELAVTERLLVPYSEVGEHDGLWAEVVRLEKGRLCPELLSYLRLLLQQQHGRVKRKGSRARPEFGIAGPSELELELKSMKVYARVVAYHVEKQTSTLLDLQQKLKDEQEKKPSPDWGKVFLLIYQVEQQLILQS